MKWVFNRLNALPIANQQCQNTNCNIKITHNRQYKKLSNRRGTARCVVSLEICQLPRNSAETTCTTSPEQIEVMKWEG